MSLLFKKIEGVWCFFDIMAEGRALIRVWALIHGNTDYQYVNYINKANLKFLNI